MISQDEATSLGVTSDTSDILTTTLTSLNTTVDALSSDATNDSATDEMGEPHNPRLVNGVIVLLLLLVNICGNSLVCFIYRRRIKPSVFSFFVTVLAALDLSTALTTQVMDVILKMRPESEKTLDIVAMCKLSHFQVYGTSLLGGCVFVLIAYQRYRKICHPLKPSMSYRQARLYVAGIAMMCTIMSIPTLLINGPTQISVLIDRGSRLVNTTICRYDTRYEGTLVQRGFSLVLLLAFAIIISITITFYTLIFRALQHFERTNSVYGGQLPASPTTPLPSIGSDNMGEQRNGGAPEYPLDVMVNAEQGQDEGQGHDPRQSQIQDRGHDPRQSKRQEEYRNASMVKRREMKGRSYSTVTMTEGGGERISSQMHRVFTVVTAVFVISYLPHLVVLILNAVLHLDDRQLTWTQRFLTELAYNCPYISTVANPFVYGFRSAEFRKHCKKILTCGGRGKRGARNMRGRPKFGR